MNRQGPAINFYFWALCCHEGVRFEHLLLQAAYGLSPPSPLQPQLAPRLACGLGFDISSTAEPPPLQ